jgi:hypothetical protein
MAQCTRGGFGPKTGIRPYRTARRARHGPRTRVFDGVRDIGGIPDRGSKRSNRVRAMRNNTTAVPGVLQGGGGRSIYMIPFLW